MRSASITPALRSTAAAHLAGTARVEALAARRLGREPVARILGMKEFWGLPLRLNDATLVPRPETETVVEAALAAIDATVRATARCALPISAPARARSCSHS